MAGGAGIESDALNTSGASYFHKPRALSRQAEANIKIEVHRDETIINHLQKEQRANMNLMFYDFNGSSAAGKDGGKNIQSQTS